MDLARLSVSILSGSGDEREFLSLPLSLYRADPLWVAPLTAGERDRWDPKKNPVLSTRWVRRFLARREGRVVGRVAAIVDPAFSARWLADSGFFGFLECEEDPETARALLGAAEASLRERGVSHVLGPVNLSTQEEVGTLIEGFESPPMVLSPYNPRYLPALIEGSGYTTHTDFHSYQWLPSMKLTPAAERIMRGGRGPSGLVVRPVDPKRWDEDCLVLHRLYNESFESVWGFVPMSWEEFRAQAGQFRPFLQPELVRIAEWDGVPAGFALALPDVNEALRPIRGRLWPFGWVRLLRAIPRVRGARFVLLGVLPRFGGRGIGVRLAAGVADACRRLGVTHGEASLVRSNNADVSRVIGALQATPVKTYRLYQKRIGPQ